MRFSRRIHTFKLPIIVWLAAFQVFPVGCVPPATTELIEQSENFTGTIAFEAGKTSTFQLSGTAPEIGQYTANGEVTFSAGEADDALVGEGVAVFTDADGDLLVAVVEWPLDAEVSGQREGDIEFRWRDSVTFADGTQFSSNGKFADPEKRPRGLVVIAIIAILLGTLCPARTCGGR